MHLKRWLTGIIALPFLIFFIVRGGLLFSSLIAAAALIGLWEYGRIARRKDQRPVDPLSVIGYVSALLVLYGAHRNSAGWMIAALVFNLLAVAVTAVMRFRSDPAVLEEVRAQVLGVVYVPLAAAFLILIRNGENGIGWLVLVLVVVFAGDTSALYVGTFMGRHKLCPAVSPGKTIEGSIGGLAANLVFGALAKAFFLPALAWPPVLLSCLLAGAAGQAGDLFESALKRTSGVKDSGALLPGHGGILDRIDALLFAAPVAYCCRVLMFTP